MGSTRLYSNFIHHSVCPPNISDHFSVVWIVNTKMPANVDLIILFSLEPTVADLVHCCEIKGGAGGRWFELEISNLNLIVISHNFSSPATSSYLNFSSWNLKFWIYSSLVNKSWKDFLFRNSLSWNAISRIIFNFRANHFVYSSYHRNRITFKRLNWFERRVSKYYRENVRVRFANVLDFSVDFTCVYNKHRNQTRL